MISYPVELNLRSIIMYKLENNNALKKIYINYLSKCIACIFPLSVLAFYFFKNIKYNSALSVCFIVNLLLILFTLSIFNNSLNDYLIKNRIIPYLRKNYSKSLSYDKNNNQKYVPSINPYDIFETSLFSYSHCWKNIQNIISGSINNTKFKIYDTNISETFLGYTATTFNGQVIEVNSDRTICNNELYIRPKKFFNLKIFKSLMQNKQLSLNNFILYSQDNNLQFEKIQNLKYFLGNYGKKNIYINIKKNTLFILINSNKSLLNQFNLVNINKFNDTQINIIFNLIKSLNY